MGLSPIQPLQHDGSDGLTNMPLTAGFPYVVHTEPRFRWANPADAGRCSGSALRASSCWSLSTLLACSSAAAGTKGPCFYGWAFTQHFDEARPRRRAVIGCNY